MRTMFNVFSITIIETNPSSRFSSDAIFLFAILLSDVHRDVNVYSGLAQHQSGAIRYFNGGKLKEGDFRCLKGEMYNNNNFSVLRRGMGDGDGAYSLVEN